MELFLLLSIGMSIVVFISIALTQESSVPPLAEHNFEPTFPLESFLLNPEKANLLNLEDQTISPDLVPGQRPQEITSKSDIAFRQEEILLVASEA